MFIGVKKNTDAFWPEYDIQVVAADIADADSDKEYYRVERNAGGIVQIWPVSSRPARPVTTQRVEIEANGLVIGSTEVEENGST